MNREKILKQAAKMNAKFLFYGFIEAPLTKQHLIRLIARGKTEQEIYSIACDIYCGAGGAR